MFVCMCNGITDRQIEAAIDEGAATLEELTAVLGVASGCGTCAAYTRRILERTLETHPYPHPRSLPRAA